MLVGGVGDEDAEEGEREGGRAGEIVVCFYERGDLLLELAEEG